MEERVYVCVFFPGGLGERTAGGGGGGGRPRPNSPADFGCHVSARAHGLLTARQRRCEERRRRRREEWDFWVSPRKRRERGIGGVKSARKRLSPLSALVRSVGPNAPVNRAGFLSLSLSLSLSPSTAPRQDPCLGDTGG